MPFGDNLFNNISGKRVMYPILRRLSILSVPEYFLAKRWLVRRIHSHYLGLVESFGQLVMLSFAISDFTLASYQRPHLEQPSMEISS